MLHQLQLLQQSPQSADSLYLQSRNLGTDLQASMMRKKAELAALIQYKKQLLQQARHHHSANFLSRHDSYSKAFSNVQLPSIPSPVPRIQQPSKPLQIQSQSHLTSPLNSKQPKLFMNTLQGSSSAAELGRTKPGPQPIKLRLPKRHRKSKKVELETETMVAEFMITPRKQKSDCSTQTDSSLSEGIPLTPCSSKHSRKFKMFKIQTNIHSPIHKVSYSESIPEAKEQSAPFTKQPTPRSLSRTSSSLEATSLPSSHGLDTGLLEDKPILLRKAKQEPHSPKQAPKEKQSQVGPPKLSLEIKPLKSEEPPKKKPDLLAALKKLQESIAAKKAAEAKNASKSSDNDGLAKKSMEETEQQKSKSDKDVKKSKENGAKTADDAVQSEVKKPSILEALQGIKMKKDPSQATDEQDQVLIFQKLIKEKLRTHLKRDMQYFRDKMKASKTEAEKIDVFEEQLGVEYLEKYLPNKPIEKPTEEEAKNMLSVVNKIRTEDPEESIKPEAEEDEPEPRLKKKPVLLAEDLNQQLKTHQEELRRLSTVSALPRTPQNPSSLKQGGSRRLSIMSSDLPSAELKNSQNLGNTLKEKLGDRLLKKIRFQQKMLSKKQDKE